MLFLTASIYNVLSPLIDVFEAVLKLFHNSVGIPWGWSIVLLTICVRAILVPLTFKQMGSMARMQILQPELKAIQNKYKDDKQRQQQEMMKFYKENNVNPLSSCLPMVAQLPVFISLYYMLRESLRIDICPDWERAHDHGVLSTAHTVACGSHGASSFLFIGDITNTAKGLTLLILIVLYVGSQLASSLMMSSATMDKNTRYVMLFMPLIFVLFVIRFPAGVLVYWITTNLWTIGQQYVIRRRIGPLRAAAAAAGTGGVVDGKESGSGGGGTGRAKPPAPRSQSPSGSSAKPKAGAANGASTDGGGGGGLGRMIGRAKPAEKEPVATAARPSGPPPKPPRKKKKRSGRRR